MSTAVVKMPTLDNNVALAAILDSLSAHVVTLNRQGRVDYASRSWLNFAREGGGDWVRIGPGADYLAVCRNASQQGELLAQKALEGIEAVLEGRLVRMSLEYPCHEPTGRQRWFLMNVDPMGEDHEGVVITHIDITERKHMESALADREAKFRGIYESNMVPVAFWNLEGFITDANDAYLKLTGVTRSELDEDKLSCQEVTRADQLNLDKQAIEEAIAKGVCTPYEKVYVRRDGRPVPVLIGGGMLPGMRGRGIVFAIDLSERKQAEEKLRESEEKNRAILQALPDLMFVQSKDGVYLDYHAKDPKVLLVPPEQFIGKNMKAVLPPELVQELARAFESVMLSSEPVIREYSLSIEGLTRNYEARMVRHNDDKILSVVRDITERKRAQQALQDLVAGTAVIGEEFFPAYVRHVAAALDVRCAMVSELANNQNSRLRTLAIWAGQDWIENYEYDIDDAPCGQVVREQKLFYCRERVQELFPQCGALKDLNAMSYLGVPLFDSSGHLLGNLCVVDNKHLTDEQLARSVLGIFAIRAAAEIGRKRAAQKLIESEERLQLALKAGRMGVWDWDNRNKTVRWSNAQFMIMGLRPSGTQPSYRTWIERVHPDDRARVRAAVEAAMAENKEYRCEYRVVWSNGSVRWVEARGEPSYDEKGECARLMGLLVDITERKRSEEELKRALAEVERLKERLEAENIYLRTEVSGVHRYGELVGQSEGIQKVLYHINQVAGTDMTVMVLGETGTGKELVARAVHGQSARRERPLVKVNCSALPGELIESELFGHEKGAFTGATARQVGRFELADGGTIFLDEVGDLPLKLQAKLLRVLQEGEFERLGSGKTIKVDVRVIAATNRNLAEAMQRGRFRPDLYYRLNVYPIGLPALRERVEDVGLLAEVFLGEAIRRLGRSYDPISEEVLEALKSYEWPGNVRELQNVIERAVVISTGRCLQLPEQWTLPSGSFSSPEAAEANGSVKSASCEATLEELERSHILQVLQQTGWRVEGPKGAATTLGLNPSTLRSRMRKLGIRRIDSPRKLALNSVSSHDI
jgi:formate hydrogenlyase transcriptional activator